MSTRIAAREKIRAIVKMRLGTEPPSDFIRMKIGGDTKTGGVIFTIEAYEDELQEFGKEADVISLEYSRPVSRLVTVKGGSPFA